MTKVSIIIPVFNGERTIARAIESCLVQDYEKFELLIVNNMSTDETLNILKTYQKKDNRVKIYDIKARGRSKARNIGLLNSKGSYIQFLDADDELLQGKLSKSVKFLEDKKEYFAYITSSCYYNELNSNSSNFILKEKYKESDLLVNNLYPINSVIFRNDRIIRFNEELEYNEDWLFWIENIYGRNLYHNRDFIGAKVNIHSSNTMSDINIMLQYEMYVRQISKDKRNSHRFSFFIKDIKAMIKYMAIENRNLKIQTLVIENSPTLYKFLSLIMKNKCFRNKIITEIELKNNYKN